jgi:hypothetical protein
MKDFPGIWILAALWRGITCAVNQPELIEVDRVAYRISSFHKRFIQISIFAETGSFLPGSSGVNLPYIIVM